LAPNTLVREVWPPCRSAKYPCNTCRRRLRTRGACSSYQWDSFPNIAAHAPFPPTRKIRKRSRRKGTGEGRGEWPGSRLVNVWNSFAGVAPFTELTPVKKFTGRGCCLSIHVRLHDVAVIKIPVALETRFIGTTQRIATGAAVAAREIRRQNDHDYDDSCGYGSGHGDSCQYERSPAQPTFHEIEE